MKEYEALCKIVYSAGDGESWDITGAYRIRLAAEIVGELREAEVERLVQERARQEWLDPEKQDTTDVYVFVMGLTEVE